jgi:hypothetical protein
LGDGNVEVVEFYWPDDRPPPQRPEGEHPP